MYTSTTVTCHECRHLGLYLVVEWPPQIAVCNGCGQVYKLIEQAGSDSAAFGLVPYKLL